MYIMHVGFGNLVVYSGSPGYFGYSSGPGYFGPGLLPNNKQKGRAGYA